MQREGTFRVIIFSYSSSDFSLQGKAGSSLIPQTLQSFQCIDLYRSNFQKYEVEMLPQDKMGELYREHEKGVLISLMTHTSPAIMTCALDEPGITGQLFECS